MPLTIIQINKALNSLSRNVLNEAVANTSIHEDDYEVIKLCLPDSSLTVLSKEDNHCLVETALLKTAINELKSYRQRLIDNLASASEVPDSLQLNDLSPANFAPSFSSPRAKRRFSTSGVFFAPESQIRKGSSPSLFPEISPFSTSSSSSGHGTPTRSSSRSSNDNSVVTTPSGKQLTPKFTYRMNSRVRGSFSEETVGLSGASNEHEHQLKVNTEDSQLESDAIFETTFLDGTDTGSSAFSSNDRFSPSDVLGPILLSSPQEELTPRSFMSDHKGSSRDLAASTSRQEHSSMNTESECVSSFGPRGPIIRRETLSRSNQAIEVNTTTRIIRTGVLHPARSVTEVPSPSLTNYPIITIPVTSEPATPEISSTELNTQRVNSWTQHNRVSSLSSPETVPEHHEEQIAEQGNFAFNR